METQFSRTELVLGKEGVGKLSKRRVAVFGIGGVGGYTAEALARSGVGAIDIIDNDKVALSNINRQIIATHSTVGQYKVDVMKARIADINPECSVTAYKTFFLPETAGEFDFSLYDYVVDAIDTVSGKIAIIEKVKQSGVPVISAMGAGNKLDPTAFEVADISKTSVCPLARVMRRELSKRGIKGVKVVYSKEDPAVILSEAKNPAAERDPSQSPRMTKDGTTQKAAPGSVAFVPPVVGLIVAGEVIKDLVWKK